MILKHFAVPVLACLLASAASVAQDVDTQPLNSLEWRLIGSFRAGRVSAVAGIPDNPNVYYFGTPGGGIWKTTDAGHVWEPIFDKERIASIGALAVAPSDSKIVYAGTGEQTPGNGVYKSSDEGRTWTHAGLEDTRFIQAVIVDAHDPNVLIAGANSIGVYVFSRPYPKTALSTARGVFRSIDGGVTWRQTLNLDNSAGVFDLAVDPGNPSVMYASLLIPGSSPPDPGKKEAKQEVLVKDTSVIYKSTDEGVTWSPLESTGLPSADRGRLGISVAAGTQGRRLYAVMNQGFFRSDDGGATWTQSTKDPRVVGNAYFSRIFSDTRNPDILYVAQTSLYRSTDGGRTFEAYVGAPSGDDFHVLWIDPNNPSRMLLGVDQGAILSVDAGKTWSSWYNQPTGQFYHIVTDQVFPYRAYAAQQDSGTQSVPSRSDSGEITLKDVESVGGFEFCFIAPDPLHPDWIYSGGWYGSVVRYDRKTGQTSTVFEKGDKYRVTQMPPLFFSPHDPHTLYLGTQHVLKTADDGKTWQSISPDLTEWDKVDNSETNPNLPRPPAIGALSVSAKDAGVMWAATTNRLVQLTRDGGAHWQKVTPAGITAPSQILYVEPSHYDAAEAFLTVGSSRQTVPAQILRTRDFGATWQSVIQGLPADESVLVVREDPVRKSLLFAGTLSSVFISFDDGGHWHALTLNLPATPVTDIEIHLDDLVISTYGRGLWVLDNISPIRQYTPELLASSAHLFHPVAATRVRWDTYEDTPLPIETPSARNPPDGVQLDYYLKATLPESPSIAIRDAGGNIVRKFSGTAVEPYLPLPNVPEYWFAKPQSVNASAGLHRFIWDLRDEAPKALPASYSGPILQYTEYTLADHAIPSETPRQQPMGPLVAPGNYSVEFTAAGQTFREPLIVKLDPRVHASQGDLEEQLQVARRIVTGMAASYEEFQQLKTLTDALEQIRRAQKVETADVDKMLKTVSEGSKESPGPGSINRDLGRLLFGVESGDQRPTEPQLQAVDAECNALSKNIALWKDFNDQLKRQNPLNLPIASAIPINACGR